jgi:hypothetical protein
VANYDRQRLVRGENVPSRRGMYITVRSMDNPEGRLAITHMLLARAVQMEHSACDGMSRGMRCFIVSFA